MSNVVIVESDHDLAETYAQALAGTGHAVKFIGSDIEAMDYLVRQRKAPDVVMLDMRRPGGVEMVVMGAVHRLSHLAQTKVLAVTQDRGCGQRASQSWGADLFLSAPFSIDQFSRAIHTLTAGLGSAAPAGAESLAHATRVWWEGEEAVFIRWTEQSLVLAWPDATETAVKIPRGAVTRLVGKGVLQLEGNIPTWARLSRPELSVSRPEHAPEAQAAAPVADPASNGERQGQQAVTAAPQAAGHRLNPPANKLSVVARLIRKLTGSSDSQRQPGSSQAV
jgi:CheY-like chemotaxis protein